MFDPLPAMAFTITALLVLTIWAIITERMEQLCGFFIFIVCFCVGIFLLSMVSATMFYILRFVASLL